MDRDANLVRKMLSSSGLILTERVQGDFEQASLVAPKCASTHVHVHRAIHDQTERATERVPTCRLRVGDTCRFEVAHCSASSPCGVNSIVRLLLGGSGGSAVSMATNKTVTAIFIIMVITPMAGGLDQPTDDGDVRFT